MTPAELVRAIRGETTEDRAELLLNLFLSVPERSRPSLRLRKLVQVGDAPAEPANYAAVQDAVASAMGEE